MDELTLLKRFRMDVPAWEEHTSAESRIRLLEHIEADVTPLSTRTEGRRWWRVQPLRRRAALVAVAAIVAIAALAIPAFGLTDRVVDFFAGTPAPSVIRESFGSLDVGAPEGMAPGVIAEQTRSVIETDINGQPAHLWVAPTRSHGFCLDLEAHQLGGGGCDRDRSLPLGVAIATAPDGPEVIYGSVLPGQAAYLRLEYDDGETDTLPMVHVSAPIDAGFFLFEIPPSHRPDGHRPVSISAMASDGSQLAAARLPHVPDMTGRHR